MKKKFLILSLVLVALAICAATLFAGCEMSDAEEGSETLNAAGATDTASSEDSDASETETELKTDAETELKTDAETESETETETETACDHSASAWRVKVAATCTSEGEKERVCELCGDVLESGIISKIAHTEEKIAGVAATCTSEGLTEGKRCSVCGEILTEQSKIAKLPHTEEIIPGVAATCTEEGLTEGKRCSVCGDMIVEQETLPAVDHVASDWIIDVPAGEETDGEKHKECLMCEEIMATETIPATGAEHTHEGSYWVVVKNATCIEEGLKNYVCACGEVVDSETIPLTPHTEETVPARASTCKEKGLTEGKKCSVCGAILVPQNEIAPAAHTEEPVLGHSATCSQSGLTDGKKCSACGTWIVTQVTIPPAGHEFEGGVCRKCGTAEPYGVWIVDGLGNPLSDIIITVYKNGSQISMHQYKGEFLPLDVNSGEYTFTLTGLAEGLVYDADACVLSPEKRSATVRVFETVKSTESIYAASPIDGEYDAQYINEGSYKLELNPNGYTFFIFTPEAAAIYTITYECESDLTLGYHGSMSFVQGSDISGSTSTIVSYENGFAASMYASYLGSNWVFSIYSDGAESCILNVKNAGDPGTRVEDLAWTPCLEDEDKVEEQLAYDKEGTYTTLDVTRSDLVAVYNETDGYYHLGDANGPVIFIDLTSPSKYIDSLQIIGANQRIGVYIYDVNGNFLEKRSYNELFMQYGVPNSTETVDEPIRVPLTSKLAEAVKNFGDKQNWWNPLSDSKLSSSFNYDVAWLLYCGYYAN